MRRRPDSPEQAQDLSDVDGNALYATKRHGEARIQTPDATESPAPEQQTWTIDDAYPT
jgi:hypothetical protein